MKKLVEIDSLNALETLMGQSITVFCANYFYTGLLTAVDNQAITIDDPKIIYETGDFNDSAWKNAETLPQKQWHIMINAIESFGIIK